MNLLKELCFSKSFVMVGDSKEKCLECKYCRAITNQKISYNTIPSEINPIFINLPIVVNLFYGDPMLQIDNTLDYLYRLEHAGHKAPVVIITKGDLTLFPKKKFDIGIGFCGLQLNENLKDYLKEENIEFLPYDGYELGLKKAISKEIEDKIYSLSEKYKVPSFRKTSCLISYTHSMERDYNAHYYRPNEMRCSKCPMYDKCFKFKHKNDSCDIDSIVLGYEIPFDYEIIDKQKHSCYLFKIGECKFPTYDASYCEKGYWKDEI
jgi:hypothetical protein